MLHRHIELYLHIIWSTWDRVPWIKEGIRPRLYGVVIAKAREHNCTLVVVGGVRDHVHVLVRAPPPLRPCDLIGALKGVSSRFAHAELGVVPTMSWSEGYALFSVDADRADELTTYIRDQPRHHDENTTLAARELPQ